MDVLQTLQSIPREQVRHMQATIAKHANRIHYGAVDTPGDALEILLHSIVDTAAREASDEPLPRDIPRDTCADWWPHLKGHWGGARLAAQVEEADPQWRKASGVPCAELIKQWDCAHPLPSRQDGMLPPVRLHVRDVCMHTCHRCGSD